MTDHQKNIEAYNRLSAHLNGEVYTLPASLSAPPAQPAPRVVKSLAECLDIEHVASEAAAKQQAESVEVVDQPQVLLSAGEAAARVVKPLRDILNLENDHAYGVTALSSDANDIRCFRAISNGALKGNALPTRLKILGWGNNKTIDGTYRAGEKTSAQLSANQKRLGFERVAIDFNHCTVPGTDANAEFTKAGHPPLIFGYGRVNAIPGDGIWLEEITWTPLGIQHARNFEDISPAVKVDNREVTMIHSVALTPNGKVAGLQFFSVANHNTHSN